MASSVCAKYYFKFRCYLFIPFPEDVRAYLGMMGFKIIINMHGEVLKVEQPGAITNDGDE